VTRYRLTVEYDGTGFVGWQRQSNGPTVQQVLEEAVTAFCGEVTVVQGAGRTDAGVHATGQVAHVDIARSDDAETVAAALNYYLRPVPVAVLAASVVDTGFHARFSAVGRRYHYSILNRRARPALDRDRVWWIPAPLDAAAMHAAAQLLVGKHDFTSFRAANCQARSPIRTLSRLDVSRDGDVISIDAAAPSFLYHQVRNLAGTLKLVGEGKWQAADVETALAARDRAAGGPTAPPGGLCLTGVEY
jgi:tRNA pseudouridine38-40 synthase